MQRSIRSWVFRLAERLSDWSSRDQWHDGIVEDVDEQRSMYRPDPLRFADLDKIESLVDRLWTYPFRDSDAALRVRVGLGSYIAGPAGNFGGPGANAAPDLRTLLEQAARGPVSERNYMAFDFHSKWLEWSLEFRTGEARQDRTGTGAVTLTMRKMQSGNSPKSIAEIVDVHSEHMSWLERRRREPLFTTRSAATVDKEAHERRLSNRSAIVGGVLGAVLGGVAGAIATMLFGG